MTTNQSSVSAKVDTFNDWVNEIYYCTRKLREYKEEGTNIDVQIFLNLHLSHGIDKQYSEMKKMLLSFSVKEKDQLGDYSWLQLLHEVKQLEDVAGVTLG